jgi:hypothetical protein
LRLSFECGLDSDVRREMGAAVFDKRGLGFGGAAPPHVAPLAAPLSDNTKEYLEVNCIEHIRRHMFVRWSNRVNRVYR